METGTSEFSRTPKPGLLRSVPAAGQAGRGTQAPGEGFALTIAERECAKLNFEHEHDRRDVILGVGLVAAKRASLIGRVRSWATSRSPWTSSVCAARPRSITN